MREGGAGREHDNRRSRWRTGMRAANERGAPAWVVLVVFASLVWPVYAVIWHQHTVSGWDFAPLLIIPAALVGTWVFNFRRSLPQLDRLERRFAVEDEATKFRALDRRFEVNDEVLGPGAILKFVISPAVVMVVVAFLPSRRGRRAEGPVLAVFLTLAIVYPILSYLYLRARAKRDASLPEHACPKCGYDMRSNPGRCSECGYERSDYDLGRPTSEYRSARQPPSAESMGMLNLRGKRLRK